MIAEFVVWINIGDSGVWNSNIPQVIYIRRTPNHTENHVDYVALNHYYILRQICTQRYNIPTNPRSPRLPQGLFTVKHQLTA